MKNLILTLLTLVACSVLTLSAQDAKLSFKDAKVYFNQYTINSKENADKLPKAISSINDAVAGIQSFEKAKDKFKVYQLAGEIYGSIAGSDFLMVSRNPNAKPSNPEAPIKSQKYFSMALEQAEKGFQKGEAMTALHNNVNYLNVMGANRLSAQDYAGAYGYYDALVKTVGILKANDYNKEIFTEEGEEENMRYVVAVTAIEAGKTDHAEEILLKLLGEGYDKAEIYESLYALYTITENKEKASKYLKEGSAKHPNNKQLLYAEINEALQKGEMESLVSKLDMAIADDPENPSLYNTLGFVYDNLFQQYYESGKEEEAKGYFDKALANYQKSLNIEESADALYSVGALYYNKAAVTAQKMAAIEDDLSNEATKKYNAYQDQVKDLMNASLPFFKKAEHINPNDINTLNALKEIFAKKGTADDIKMSKDVEKRIRSIQAGNELTEPMF